MSIFLEALSWLTTPANWLGGSGILTRSAEHLGLTLLIVVLAALIALPLGTVIGHTGRGRWLVSATGAARAIPTLGVLTLAGLCWASASRPQRWRSWCWRFRHCCLQPIRGLPRRRARPWMRRERLDSRSPKSSRRWRSSRGRPRRGGRALGDLQVIATTTLAAYTANYGLGRFLYTGLKTRDYAQMIGGAIVVVALALATDALLAFIARRLRDRTHSFSDEEKNSLKESL